MSHCMYVIIHLLMQKEQTNLEFLKHRKRVFSKPGLGRLDGIQSFHKEDSALGKELFAVGLYTFFFFIKG